MLPSGQFVLDIHTITLRTLEFQEWEYTTNHFTINISFNNLKFFSKRKLAQTGGGRHTVWLVWNIFGLIQRTVLVFGLVETIRITLLITAFQHIHKLLYSNAKKLEHKIGSDGGKCTEMSFGPWDWNKPIKVEHNSIITGGSCLKQLLGYKISWGTRVGERTLITLPLDLKQNPLIIGF